MKKKDDSTTSSLAPIEVDNKQSSCFVLLWITMLLTHIKSLKTKKWLHHSKPKPLLYMKCSFFFKSNYYFKINSREL